MKRLKPSSDNLYISDWQIPDSRLSLRIPQFETVISLYFRQNLKIRNRMEALLEIHANLSYHRELLYY